MSCHTINITIIIHTCTYIFNVFKDSLHSSYTNLPEHLTTKKHN
ncbi:hypothetical protein F383_24341 [Gossypium arboreum]|uniref:Uncharacterized protein n=1 Tax=Gossypium arboreum TaxID=29729 RepID=A0A0B0MT94_GOSAR|nr:hypothetical protein F383_24341 [Gossypium arboreum]